MNKKQLKEKVGKILELYNNEDYDNAYSESESLISSLFMGKKFQDIVDIDKKLESVPIMFEVAYSYDFVGDYNKAEELYETILNFPDKRKNSAILNNLSNIKKQKGKTEEAFDLIKKAFDLNPDDEVIKNNYKNLLISIQEKDQLRIFFESAKDNLKRETEWALNKLQYFLNCVKKDKNFKNGKIPIARYKFKILIGTDEQKADSLRDQWLEKGYIRDTKEKGDFSVSIYEINPNLEKYLETIKPKKFNKEWLSGFENLNNDNLEKLNYFKIIEKIEKTNKKYKEKILRDFNELTINYLFKNKKTVAVLSGSFIELLFTYICEKGKITKISYQLDGKTINQKIYDARLYDFLQYFEQNKKYKDIVIHISNITRIYRNFIHPGNEIKNNEELTDSKFELCYYSVLELVNYIL